MVVTEILCIVYNVQHTNFLQLLAFELQVHMEQTMHDAVSYMDSCRIMKQSQQISISDTNSRPNAAKQAHKTALILWQ